MKRTPLKRRTPLRSRTPMKRTGFALKRRTKLKPMSAAKRTWTQRYHRALTAAKSEQIATTGNTYCTLCGVIGPVEGHHTQGRTGASILVFILGCRGCHQNIHENARASRKAGLLK